MTYGTKMQMRRFQYRHGIKQKSNTKVLAFIGLSVLSIATIGQFVNAQRDLRAAKADYFANTSLTEPSDVQPALGYRVLSSTYNPQGQ